MARTLLETHRHPKYPRLALDLRTDSRFYQSRVYLDGRVLLKSTKTTELPAAFRVAEVWYKRLLRASVAEGRQHPIDRLATEPTIAELFASYKLTLPKHRREYVTVKWGAMVDYWRTIVVTDVTPKLIRAYYTTRRRHKTHMKSVVTNNTLHKDATLLRQILTHAKEEGHIGQLLIIPHPGKIEANPRPWLSRAEWEQLAATSNRRMKDVENNRRLSRQRQDLDDFMWLMIESMMRVSEIRSLTAGQCRIMPETHGQPSYVVIAVKGKTGHRTVIAGGLAPMVIEGRSNGLKPTDHLWKYGQRDAFRELLIAAELRTDEFGNTRNLKSIRATAISLRILAQAPSPNLLLIARNAGTSVAMIDAYYARRLTAEMGADQLSASIGV